MRIKLTAVILIIYVGSAFGQTISDIEMKYGKPVNAYSVSEHIWMTPEYTAQGQVCRVRLYPKRIAPDTNFFSKGLPVEELKRVLNQLTPLQTRGAKRASFGITETGGGTAWTTYPYEKVTFIFTTSFKVDPEILKDLTPYVFSIEPSPSDVKEPENTPPSEDDFFSGQASNTEIVTIKWNERKCGGK